MQIISHRSQNGRQSRKFRINLQRRENGWRALDVLYLQGHVGKPHHDYLLVLKTVAGFAIQERLKYITPCLQFKGHAKGTGNGNPLVIESASAPSPHRDPCAL